MKRVSYPSSSGLTMPLAQRLSSVMRLFNSNLSKKGAQGNGLELMNLKSRAALFTAGSVSLITDTERLVFEYCGVDAMWALTLLNKSAHRWVRALLHSTFIRHFTRFHSTLAPRYIVPSSCSSHPLKVLKALSSPPSFSSTASLLSGHCNWVQAISYSPDGRYVVTASMDMTCRVWVQDQREQWTCSDLLLGHEGHVHVISHSPFESYFVTGSSDKTCLVWEKKSDGKWGALPALTGHASEVVNVCHSADGRYFVSSSCDRTCFVWRRNPERQWVASASLSGHLGYISELVWHPYRHELVTVSLSDGICCIWSSPMSEDKPWNLQAQAHGHEAGVLTVAYSPNGRFFVSGSKDCTARVWQEGANNEWVCAEVLQGHEGAVVCLGFHPSSRYFITGSLDSTCVIWSEGQSGQWRASQRIRGDGSGVSLVTFGCDGSYFVMASQEQYYQVFQQKPAGSASLLEAWRENVKSHTPCVGHSPDGCHFFASSVWGDCRLFSRAPTVQPEPQPSRCTIV